MLCLTYIIFIDGSGSIAKTFASTLSEPEAETGGGNEFAMINIGMYIVCFRWAVSLNIGRWQA